jgi:hypothetical protein
MTIVSSKTIALLIEMAIEGDGKFKLQTLPIFVEVFLESDVDDFPIDLETLSLFRFFLSTRLPGDQEVAAMARAVVYFVTKAPDLQIVSDSGLLIKILRFKNVKMALSCVFIVNHLLEVQAHILLRSMVDHGLIPYLLHAFEDHDAFEDERLFDIFFTCLVDLMRSNQEEYLPILEKSPCRTERSHQMQDYLLEVCQNRTVTEGSRKRARAFGEG